MADSTYKSPVSPADGNQTEQGRTDIEALLRGLDSAEGLPLRTAPQPVAEKANRFSFAWFFLVFWLTLIITVITSWQMIVA